jgi:hypothetical protein
MHGCLQLYRKGEATVKSLLNLSRSTRIVLCALLVVTTLVAWYSGWGFYRVTCGILDLIENPRAFPHPDQTILWLNDWYDRRYPAEPGYFKIHGEIDRVRLTFLAVFAPSALFALILLQLVLMPWLYPRNVSGHRPR